MCKHVAIMDTHSRNHCRQVKRKMQFLNRDDLLDMPVLNVQINYKHVANYDIYNYVTKMKWNSELQT